MNYTTTRRKLLKAGLLGAATTAMPFARAAKAEYTLRFSNNASLDHPINTRANEAIARIKEESNGRLDIRVFPNNQLGGDTDTLSQIRQGAIDMLSMPSSILATVAPEAAITGVGFAFNGYEPLWEAMDGELGAYVRRGIEKTGLFAMPKIWDNGFRQITTSTQPIRTADDFAGVKIRVPVSPLHVSLFKSLGAAPVTMNYSELYSALQTKVVDGQDNALVLLPFAKFYEVQTYASITNHMWDGFWQLINQRSLDRLPADLQDILLKNWDLAADDQRADMFDLNNNAQELLTSKGMIFNETDTDSFRTKLTDSGFYTEWKEEFGPEAWSTLEKYSGPLA